MSNVTQQRKERNNVVKRRILRVLVEEEKK